MEVPLAFEGRETTTHHNKLTVVSHLSDFSGICMDPTLKARFSRYLILKI